MKILNELMSLVRDRANERYILSKLKTLRYQEIGEDNIRELYDCLQWKDVDYFKKKRVNMSEVSMDWYDGAPYQTYIDYFNRWLTEKKLAEIKENSKSCEIILPNECMVESVGLVSDTSSIIRLKKSAKDVASDLKSFGVPENYAFVNMKLFVSFYHHIHCPVNGKIRRAIPIEGDSNFFGNNTLWFVEFETDKSPVFMLIIGESAIQDFNFMVRKGQSLEKGDNLGYFAWGSHTVLLYNPDDYSGELGVQRKNHYFFGQRIL